MADIETRVVIGADTGALDSGMAAALAAVQAAAQGMRVQLAGLGTTARQVQSQIGTAMTQVGVAVRASVESWHKLSAPIERTISGALTDATLGIRQRGGIKSVMLGIEKQVVGGMVGNVVKNVGNSLLKPVFTSLMGRGGLLGGAAHLLFGGATDATKISLLSIIAANTGTTAAAAGVSAASTSTSAIGTGFSAVGALSGVGKAFSWVGGLFGFAHGGIVPSAAGGWSLPSFAGAQPALLHSQEMVLPADISQGLQGMIRGGGPFGANGGGDVHVHNHFHGPADGASVGRWFDSNRGQLASTIRDAWNSGALAFP